MRSARETWIDGTSVIIQAFGCIAVRLDRRADESAGDFLRRVRVARAIYDLQNQQSEQTEKAIEQKDAKGTKEGPSR